MTLHLTLIVSDKSSQIQSGGATKGKSLAAMEAEARKQVKEKISDMRDEQFGYMDTKDDGAVTAPAKIAEQNAQVAAKKKKKAKKKKIPFWKDEKSVKVSGFAFYL